MAQEEGKRRHRLDRTDSLRANIDIQRGLRRWLFPVLVVAITVLVVTLLLLQQHAPSISLE